MKRSALLILLLLISMSFVFAQENVTDTAQIKIDKAYDCLDSKISGRCSTIAPQEKIFSLLATGQCREEVIADSLNAECWPSSGCTLKQTAQAILALSHTTTDTAKAEEWLISQNASPEDVEWYLQIESGEETRCVITYDGIDHPIVLKDDKTLSTSAKPCLSLSSGDWWLKVAPGCYNREFQISCDEEFQTNLLFKIKSSAVIHVSDITNSASANGRTYEKINSACFMQGGKCNYEGSLWAALVLNSQGHDVSAFLPYLTTAAEENSDYLPESFLYLLTGQDDYKINLLLKQKSNKYWSESGNKFYDTAVALYSVTDEPLEKINAKNWLLEVQDSEGCWQGNIRDTAFILSSIWPRTIETTMPNCVDSGHYCLSEISCTGNTLSSYKCPGVLKCCDTLAPIQSCPEQNGNICNSNEQCVGGTSPSASDTGVGEVCCVGGTCEVVALETECESYDGTCRTFGCITGEDEVAYSCDFGDSCCMTGAGGGSYWWIWLLLILIILVVLGIVFREKLRPYYYKILSVFKRKPSAPSVRPGPGMPVRRYTPRRILPPSQRAPVPVKKPTPPGELSDVLKRLKEMSK